MSRCRMMFALAALVVLVVIVAPGAARAGATATKPKLSAAPVLGVPFTASGVVKPRATAVSRTAVQVKLYQRKGVRWVAKTALRARLAAAPSGTKYVRQMVVPAKGRYALRAFHYRAGRLVARSPLAVFDVARRVTIDSNVNGWLAPGLRDTVAPADTPLDIVFTRPADWSAPRDDGQPVNGAAHFIWGDFTKVDADGLIWHTDGLRPGRYDWMRDAMPKWGTGCLAVAQPVAVDKASHGDVHVLPHLPADISFGDVSSAGMGCDRSIAFLTRVFTQTSADPLQWYTAGLPPGRYDWKCWMDECHFGTLVADGAAQTVAIDTDLDDSVTVVPAGTPVDLVFNSVSGAGMVCWRTIFFTTAGDLIKTRAHPDPVTWRSGGLAPGSYEWECWMGPQCHHGVVIAE